MADLSLGSAKGTRNRQISSLQSLERLQFYVENESGITVVSRLEHGLRDRKNEWEQPDHVLSTDANNVCAAPRFGE